MLRPTILAGRGGKAIQSRVAAQASRQIHTTRPRFQQAGGPGQPAPGSYRPATDPTYGKNEAGNKTYAIIGALVLGVGGYYGLMMGSPRTAVPPGEDKGANVAGTSVTSKRASEAATGKVNPNNPQ